MPFRSAAYRTALGARDAAGAAVHWEADSEDSRTPMATLLLESHRLLGRCLDGTIGENDALRHGHGEGVRRSQPIKRIPGLGVPDGHHLLNGEPLPLHVVDLGLHAFHHRRRAEALSFFVPKPENEEEAAYVAALLDAVEEELAAVEPGFVRRTLRVIVVFENPRAIFRVGARALAGVLRRGQPGVARLSGRHNEVDEERSEVPDAGEVGPVDRDQPHPGLARAPGAGAGAGGGG